MSNENIPPLTYYDSRWKKFFRDEKKVLQTLIPQRINVHINHIGSTAVEGLVSRPIIDIVIGVENPLDLYSVRDLLIHNKYLFLIKSSTIDHLILVKRAKEKTPYTIHLVKYNGTAYREMMKIVKILTENNLLAHQYGELKRQLLSDPKNAKIYSLKKRDFIRSHLN